MQCDDSIANCIDATARKLVEMIIFGAELPPQIESYRIAQQNPTPDTACFDLDFLINGICDRYSKHHSSTISRPFQAIQTAGLPATASLNPADESQASPAPTLDDLRKMMDEKIKASEDLTHQKFQDAMNERLAASELETQQTAGAANGVIGTTNTETARHNTEIKSVKAEILGIVDDKIKASNVLDVIQMDLNTAKSELMTHVDETINKQVKELNERLNNLQEETINDYLMNAATSEIAEELRNMTDSKISTLQNTVVSLEEQIKELKSSSPAPSIQAVQHIVQEYLKNLKFTSPTVEETEKMVKTMIDDFFSREDFAGQDAVTMQEVQEVLRKSEVQNYENTKNLKGMIKQSKEDVVKLLGEA